VLEANGLQRADVGPRGRRTLDERADARR
jgi:hypothetical protein